MDVRACPDEVVIVRAHPPHPPSGRLVMFSSGMENTHHVKKVSAGVRLDGHRGHESMRSRINGTHRADVAHAPPR